MGMNLSLILIYSITILSIAGILAMSLSFVASIIFFTCNHSVGTITYLIKITLITFIALPLCILLLAAVFLSPIWSAFLWIRKHWRRPTGTTPPLPQKKFSAYDRVVYLVHGTFEKNALWTYPNSPMARQIRLINPTVKIERFEWSSANTHDARIKAAEEFGQILRTSGSHNQFIIAHSHAGNIVQLLSQHASDVASKVKGVCLLSTPFIYKKTLERSGGPLTLLHAIGFASFAALVTTVITWCAGALNVVVTALAFVLALIADYFVSRYCKTKLEQEGFQDNNSIAFRNIQIMLSIGDEADSGLRFISTLHEACFSVFSQLAAADRLLKQAVNTPYLICYCLHVISWAVSMLIYPDNWVLLTLAFIISFIGISISHGLTQKKSSKEISSILIMAGLPISLVAFYINAAKSIAYGDWRLIFRPNTFIFSSETPVGDHSVQKYAPNSDDLLVHSLHSHKNVIRDVAAWVKCDGK